MMESCSKPRLRSRLPGNPLELRPDDITCEGPAGAHLVAITATCTYRLQLCGPARRMRSQICWKEPITFVPNWHLSF
jgi:hypothetical protein